MDYSKLTPLLVEAAKEQQRQIEEQRSQIEDLRRVNAGLRGQVVSQGRELGEMREQLTSLMEQMAAMETPHP
jgi:chromosome segregation ATPase